MDQIKTNSTHQRIQIQPVEDSKLSLLFSTINDAAKFTNLRRRNALLSGNPTEFASDVKAEYAINKLGYNLPKKSEEVINSRLNRMLFNTCSETLFSEKELEDAVEDNLKIQMFPRYGVDHSDININENKLIINTKPYSPIEFKINEHSINATDDYSGIIEAHTLGEENTFELVLEKDQYYKVVDGQVETENYFSENPLSSPENFSDFFETVCQKALNYSDVLNLLCLFSGCTESVRIVSIYDVSFMLELDSISNYTVYQIPERGEFIVSHKDNLRFDETDKMSRLTLRKNIREAVDGTDAMIKLPELSQNIPHEVVKSIECLAIQYQNGNLDDKDLVHLGLLDRWPAVGSINAAIKEGYDRMKQIEQHPITSKVGTRILEEIKYTDEPLWPLS